MTEKKPDIIATSGPEERPPHLHFETINPPQEHILVPRGEPKLDTRVLEELSGLIGDLYPGLWEVFDHGPAHPHDYAIGIGTQADTGDVRLPERTVLPGPIGHHNLARYLAMVQPKALRGLLEDNRRLRIENAELRAGRGRFLTE